jgi:hypothetical protein
VVVPHVGDDGETHGVGIERSGSGTSADSAAGTTTGVIGDLPGFGSGAAGVGGLNGSREAVSVRRVCSFPLGHGAFA